MLLGGTLFASPSPPVPLRRLPPLHQLTSLRLERCGIPDVWFVDLLGPGAPLRRTIEVLELFHVCIWVHALQLVLSPDTTPPLRTLDESSTTSPETIEELDEALAGHGLSVGNEGEFGREGYDWREWLDGVSSEEYSFFRLFDWKYTWDTPLVGWLVEPVYAGWAFPALTCDARLDARRRPAIWNGRHH